MQHNINETPQVAQHLIKPDGNFPNNDDLPVLHYKAVFICGDQDLADIMEDCFSKNNWGNAWRNGIYDYHHYHSNTHEVLGIAKGQCKVQVGGPDGIILELMEGDVIVLPAGTAHKNVGCSEDFQCVGAYPGNSDYDMYCGKAEEKEQALKNIEKVPIPKTDPVYGDGGFLSEHWLIKEETMS
jgi:uncharacterized protein YjlB